MKSEVSSVLWHKNSNFLFRCLISLFEPHSSEYTFFFLGNKIALFWAYHKKSVFPFSLLKHVALSFIAQKTCFGLLAVILGCFQCYCTKKKGFFQYAASHSDFHLILLKQRFCFLLARLSCFRIVFLRTTFFSVFVTKLHFGHSILPRKCFDLLATELGYL